MILKNQRILFIHLKIYFMAILINGLFGPISGTLGPLVFCDYKRYNLIRLRSTKKRTESTPAQKAQEARIRIASKFLHGLKGLLNITYKQYGSKMSPRDAAMSELLRHAITGTYPDLEINYAKVILAKGSSVVPVYANCESKEPGMAHFSWENPYGLGEEDTCILVAHCPDVGKSVYQLHGPPRSNRWAALQVPFFKGKLVHTWIAFKNAKGDVSDSFYAGTITVL
jgi:hypothetical protein